MAGWVKEPSGFGYDWYVLDLGNGDQAIVQPEGGEWGGTIMVDGQDIELDTLGFEMYDEYDAQAAAETWLDNNGYGYRYASKTASISEDDLYFDDDMYRFDADGVSGFVAESPSNGWEYYVYSYDKGELSDGGFSSKDEAFEAMNAEIAKYENKETFYASKTAISNDDYVQVIRDLTGQFPRERYHAEVSDLGFRDTFDLGINWASIGAVTTDEAREFAQGIIEMADAIDAQPYTVGEPVDFEASRTASWNWQADDGFSGAPTHYDGQYAYVLAEPGEYYDNGWCVQVFDTEDEHAWNYGELYDEFGPFDSAEQAKQYAENNKVGSRKTAWTLDWPKLDDVVSVYEKNDWGTGEATGYEIGWSSIGAVDIEDAREFAQRILEMCDELQKFAKLASRKTADTSGKGTTPGGIGYEAKVPTGFINGSFFMEPADKYKFEDFVDSVGLDASAISKYLEENRLYNVFSEFDGTVLRDNGRELVIQLAPEGSTLKLTKEGSRKDSKKAMRKRAQSPEPYAVYEVETASGKDKVYILENGAGEWGWKWVDADDGAVIDQDFNYGEVGPVVDYVENGIGAVKVSEKKTVRKRAKMRRRAVSDSTFGEIVENTLAAMMDYLEDGYGEDDPKDEALVLADSVADILGVELTDDERFEVLDIVLDELGIEH